MIDTYYQELPPLWDHQAESIGDLCRGSYALYWEVRTGKTRACCEALRVLAATDAIDGVLILPPVNAKAMWARWLSQLLPTWRVQTLDGLKPYPISGDAVICNPDILHPQVRGRLFRGWQGELIEFLGRRRIVVIEDESQLYFMNFSKRWRAGASLTRLANRTWQLSGTPFEKSGLDIHHQLKHLGPRYPFYLLSDEQFGHAYCEVRPDPFRGRTLVREGISRKTGRPYKIFSDGVQYGAIKDPQRFWSELLPYCVDRRLRRDCLDIPQSQRFDLWVDSYQQPASPGQWQQQRQELVPLKVRLTAEHVLQLLQEGPTRQVVVYGWNRAFVADVAASLRLTGLNAPVIWGGTSATERARIEAGFQGGQYRVIVVNIRAGGTAAEYTAADVCVFGQIDWRAALLRQAEGRQEGSTQAKLPEAHYLLVRDSHEEHMWDSVLMKGRAMDELDEAARQAQAVLGQWAYGDGEE